MAEQAHRPGRRRIALIGGCLAVVLVVVGIWFATRGSSDDPSPSAGATSTAPATPGAQPSVAPSNPPTPTPTGPTGDAAQQPGTLAPVGLDETADAGDGISGRLVSVTAIQGDGEGVGNVDGPALQVTVELANSSSEPVSVAAVAVEMYSGPDLTPASPLEDATSRPFAGTIEPGGSATGVYVFTIAEDQREDVTVQVAYEAGVPYLVFRGTVS